MMERKARRDFLTAFFLCKIIKIAANWRAKTSRDIKNVMKSYTFDATTLPEICKQNRKRQFKYMMDAMRYMYILQPANALIKQPLFLSRFARKDYSSSGAILQSAALGDVIAKVFYNARKGIGLTLHHDDSDYKVPRALIALTFVFVSVCLTPS